MLKKMLTSPVGIALAVAGVVLALSPEARQATRKLVVKGTAALLGAVDSVKQTMADVTQDVTVPVAGALTAGAGTGAAALNGAAETAKATTDAATEATADWGRQATEGVTNATGVLADALEATPAASGTDQIGHEFH